MPQKSYWRRTSATVIGEVIRKYYTAHNLPVHHTPTKSERKEIERELRDAYPFHHRGGFAYSCWLKERKSALFRLYGVNIDRPNKNAQSPGQLSLL